MYATLNIDLAVPFVCLFVCYEIQTELDHYRGLKYRRCFSWFSAKSHCNSEMVQDRGISTLIQWSTHHLPNHV